MAESSAGVLPEILRQILSSLEEASIPHMLTGSLAAAYYAVPRATQDIDLVVEASQGQLEDLAARLTDLGFYVSGEAIAEAVRHEGQFNVIDPRTGWKADLILRKRRAFSICEFGRRRAAKVLGVELALASPEDLVIAKLEWSKRGGSELQLSELQLRDVAAVLGSRGEELDREYVARWVGELGLQEQWEAVAGERKRSDPVEPST